jgi:thioredoxin
LNRILDAPIHTGDQSVDRVISAGLPVLLVLLNGPAAPALQSALEQLAREQAGRLLVALLQVRENPEAARRFAAPGYPAVVGVLPGQAPDPAQPAGAGDIPAWAAYLLGKGPRPAAARPAPAAGAARAAHPSASTHPPQGASAGPQAVTDATFDQLVMRSDQPVLVDFWAPWCGPCRMVEPVIEKLAHELAGRVRVAKVNVDENPVVSGRYGVQSIPTMMVVKNGKIVDRWAGALPEPALRSRIAPLIAG